MYPASLRDKSGSSPSSRPRGPWRPWRFILIQALQGGLRPHPREAPASSAATCSGAPGLLYSYPRLTLGSVGAFSFARWLEEHYVKRWIPAEILQKFDS